jgi:hypothetical protein
MIKKYMLSCSKHVHSTEIETQLLHIKGHARGAYNWQENIEAKPDQKTGLHREKKKRRHYCLVEALYRSIAIAAPATRDKPTGPAVAPGAAAPVPVDDAAEPDEVAVPEALLPDPEAVSEPEAEAEAVVVKPVFVVPLETGLVVSTGLVEVVGVGTTTGVVSPAGIEAAPGCEVTTAGWLVMTLGWPVTAPRELVSVRYCVAGLSC